MQSIVCCCRTQGGTRLNVGGRDVLMKNQVQLITYVDRLGGGNVQRLASLLRGPLRDLFGGIHLLPFFDAIDGADAGFDPKDHTRVDPRLGDWQDIKTLSGEIDVMADVIVNHVSSESPQFCDYLNSGANSKFGGMFLTRESVFPHGASDADLARIYRPRPGQPFTPITLANGEQQTLWTTFTPQQIDIDVQHPQGIAYLDRILRTFAAADIRMVRLDAVGYAIKKQGTSCFMIPETYDFIQTFAQRAKALDIEVLVEIHSYYQQQIDIASRVDRVYDFALPPLVLHALSFGTGKYLKHWIDIRPTNTLTVLDTHDGIGIIDIGADRKGAQYRPGLVPDDELDQLVEIIHRNSKDSSRLATGAAASNLDLYQVNCTFYDALGRHDVSYLLARALQFFLPGVPQIYYVGLLAGTNDIDLLKRTAVGRDINRHYYGDDELAQQLDQPVVRELCELIRLRNTNPAFSGHFSSTLNDSVLTLRWDDAPTFAELTVDFASASGMIRSGNHGVLETRTYQRNEWQSMSDACGKQP